MTLPASGTISFNDINVELGVAGTTTANINQASYRTLAGVPSGTIALSNFYGKANEFNFTISSNQTDANLRSLAVAAGWNQTSIVNATVGSGVYVYATSTANAGLTINGAWPNGVTLINNGYIMGKGGSAIGSTSTGVPGGSAISMGLSGVTITNNSYIAGGGGSGALGAGGGGAGGGDGGPGASTGGVGGGPGASGTDGTGNGGYNFPKFSVRAGGGGGGGRILPGTGGAGGIYGNNVNVKGIGGGAGGGGGSNFGGDGRAGGTGGSAGNPGGPVPAQGGWSSGGGGGWGAPGGAASFSAGPPGSAPFGGDGGKAIALNGYSVTRNGSGTTYGSVA
jgi:hypothetical protein